MGSGSRLSYNDIIIYICHREYVKEGYCHKVSYCSFGAISEIAIRFYKRVGLSLQHCTALCVGVHFILLINVLIMLIITDYFLRITNYDL